MSARAKSLPVSRGLLVVLDFVFFWYWGTLLLSEGRSNDLILIIGRWDMIPRVLAPNIRLLGQESRYR